MGLGEYWYPYAGKEFVFTPLAVAQQVTEMHDTGSIGFVEIYALMKAIGGVRGAAIHGVCLYSQRSAWAIAGNLCDVSVMQCAGFGRLWCRRAIADNVARDGCNGVRLSAQFFSDDLQNTAGACATLTGCASAFEPLLGLRAPLRTSPLMARSLTALQTQANMALAPWKTLEDENV